MQLQLSTWCEIKEYLKNRTDIIIPIGSTEQHGPMGLIGTDAICPEIVAKRIGERENILVAPTINVGMSQHHLQFPGSMSLRPSTLMAVVKDMVTSLAGNGFTHIMFLNGHGGNKDSLKAAFSEYYAEHSFAGIATLAQLKLISWWEGDRFKAVSDKYFKDVDGHHAMPSELSLSFCAYPDAVKSAELDPKVAPNGDFTDSSSFAEKFPDGRMGSDSSLASVEIGQEILDAAVEDVLKMHRAFLLGRGQQAEG